MARKEPNPPPKRSKRPTPPPPPPQVGCRREVIIKIIGPPLSGLFYARHSAGNP